MAATYDRFDAPDDPPLAAFRQLMRAALRGKRALGPLLNQAGLTGAQFHTLVRIPEEGIPVTKLAAKAWSDPGNASGVIDRLEREGLVERRAAAHDRRVVLVRLTAAGRQRVEQLWPAFRRRIQRIMAPLDHAELSRLGKLLEQIEATED